MIFFKKSINVETIECMKYICDKIISFIRFENLHTHFKSRVVGGIIVWIIFFMVNDIDTYQLIFKQFKCLNFLNEI